MAQARLLTPKRSACHAAQTSLGRPEEPQDEQEEEEELLSPDAPAPQPRGSLRHVAVLTTWPPPLAAQV